MPLQSVWQQELGRVWGLNPPSQPFPTDLPRVTLSTLELVLELRPRSAKGIVLHLGGEQTPPYLQLQLVGTQVRSPGVHGRGLSWLRTPHPHAPTPTP